MSQACCHCECQSYGVLCSSLARQDRTAVNFTFPNKLPSTVASSVSSLAYPSHVPVNIFPNRVQSSASNQLASSVSSSRTLNCRCCCYIGQFLSHTTQTIRGMASSVLPLAYSNRDQDTKASRSFCRREHAHGQCRDSDFAADQYVKIRCNPLLSTLPDRLNKPMFVPPAPSTLLFFT